MTTKIGKLITAFLSFSLAFSLPAVDAGDQYLKSKFKERVSGKEVEAFLHVPKKITENKSMNIIIFYHGSTGDKKAYYNQVKNNLLKWSDKYNFVLLSVQNYYGLPSKNDQIQGNVFDTYKATLDLTEQIKLIGLTGRIFVTGASSGGQMANVTVLKSPNLFHGIGSFKGNFYHLGVYYNMKGEKPSSSEEYGIFLGEIDGTENIQKEFDAYFQRLKDRKLLIFMCSGGKKDIPRIKTQQEDAKEWYGNFEIPIIIKNYPEEGHGMTEKNFLDFWNLIIK